MAIPETFQDEVAQALRKGSDMLRAARLPQSLCHALDTLADQVFEPCVAAVVGRAKAGKSSFINAFLGDDLAKVGITETTATINFFRYGIPPNPAKPVRCYWKGGTYEDVGRDFLDSLQGNDLDTLRRAAGIERLEYLLPHEALREVTLVDTPGTEAAVKEHVEATAEFLQLTQQLREQHAVQTERWAGQADAVIYLISQVPRSTDEMLLKEFQHVTGGKSQAFNAIGVLAKVDLYPEIIGRIPKIREQLRTCLNTVVPVSAGLRRALDILLADGQQRLSELCDTLRRIPKARLEKLLASDELYEMEFPDCPVTVEARLRIRGNMPWNVFTTIARVASDPELPREKLIAELDQLSGFKELKEVLERHVFRRAKLLRSYRILRDTQRILNEVKYRRYREALEADKRDQERLQRYTTFLRMAGQGAQEAKEIEEILSRVLMPDRAERLEAVAKELDRILSDLMSDLDDHNSDFEALMQLEQNAAKFNGDELEELRSLFGLYGLELKERLRGITDIQIIAERQQNWAARALSERDPVRRSVAEHAGRRYGSILYELAKRDSA
ncbi:MAG: hypothetical protein KatS3mg110_3476 [Pirellulaceae bacterium]|nr:MAG: hypothetical protein KatS3mg110_3476 [Pirellulaceae bacterium]